MPKSINRDFFEKTKGFLAAFDQVANEGFFESFNVEVGGIENIGTTSVIIRATAFLPDSRKDMAPGVKLFIDPWEVIEVIRYQLRSSKFVLDSRNCEVTTTDWVKYGMVKGEEVVVGKRGLKLTFQFMVFLKPKSWLKKD